MWISFNRTWKPDLMYSVFLFIKSNRSGYTLMNTAAAKTFRYPKVITRVKRCASLNHADSLNKHSAPLAEAMDANVVISPKCKQTENTRRNVRRRYWILSTARRSALFGNQWKCIVIGKTLTNNGYEWEGRTSFPSSDSSQSVLVLALNSQASLSRSP